MLRGDNSVKDKEIEIYIDAAWQREEEIKEISDKTQLNEETPIAKKRKLEENKITSVLEEELTGTDAIIAKQHREIGELNVKVSDLKAEVAQLKAQILFLTTQQQAMAQDQLLIKNQAYMQNLSLTNQQQIMTENIKSMFGDIIKTLSSHEKSLNSLLSVLPNVQPQQPSTPSSPTNVKPQQTSGYMTNNLFPLQQQNPSNDASPKTPSQTGANTPQKR